MTDRRVEDSLSATVYFNRQSDARDEILAKTPTVQSFQSETDNLEGLNVAFGKFVRGQHFLYGVDVTSEGVHSLAHDLNLSTAVSTPQRGRYTPNAEYRTLGAYIQDRFDIGRWVTTTAGVRYGMFQSVGSENSSFGVMSIDEQNGDFTGALNVVFHPTSRLNLIANAMRGFRAPNIDDLSRFSVSTSRVDVPNPNAGPEHVNSYEVGGKYEGRRLSGSIFYYNNSFSNLLVRTPGLFNGLPFMDTNHNGVKDPKELPVFQMLNLGTGTMTGFEGDFHYSVSESTSVSGNLTQTRGTDTYANVPLDRIPPIFGNLTFSVFGSTARRLWGEFSFDFAGSQHRISPNDIADYRIGPGGTLAYHVYSVRGGATLVDRVRLTVGIDNLTNKAYKTHDSWVYRPGRQLVVGTEYRF